MLGLLERSELKDSEVVVVTAYPATNLSVRNARHGILHTLREIAAGQNEEYRDVAPVVAEVLEAREEDIEAFSAEALANAREANPSTVRLKDLEAADLGDLEALEELLLGESAQDEEPTMKPVQPIDEYLVALENELLSERQVPLEAAKDIFVAGVAISKKSKKVIVIAGDAHKMKGRISRKKPEKDAYSGRGGAVMYETADHVKILKGRNKGLRRIRKEAEPVFIHKAVTGEFQLPKEGGPIKTVKAFLTKRLPRPSASHA